MILKPEHGVLKIIKINAAACASGSILIALFTPDLVTNYIAYGLSGTLCVYLISRYVIESVDFLSENKFLASSAIYTSAGLLTALMSMCGVLGIIYFGKMSGLEYISFIVVGGELGDYRKIILNGK